MVFGKILNLLWQISYDVIGLFLIAVNGQMSKKVIKTSGHTVRVSADVQSALNLQLCIKDLPKVFRIGYFKVMSSCRQVQEKSFETNFFWSFLS